MFVNFLIYIAPIGLVNKILVLISFLDLSPLETNLMFSELTVGPMGRIHQLTTRDLWAGKEHLRCRCLIASMFVSEFASLFNPHLQFCQLAQFTPTAYPPICSITSPSLNGLALLVIPLAASSGPSWSLLTSGVFVLLYYIIFEQKLWNPLLVTVFHGCGR